MPIRTLFTVLITMLFTGCTNTTETPFSQTAMSTITLNTCIESTTTPDIQTTEPTALSSQKTDYKKISSQEAMDMMSEDVIILDVRSQQEYDTEHIKDAILWDHNPYWYFSNGGKFAKAIIPNTDSTVLVYSRTGRWSLETAKQLIELGYTKVYDFGGIGDWTGETVKKQVQDPIEYVIKRRINEDMPEFIFNLQGERIGKRDYDPRLYIKISKITVTSTDGKLSQVLLMGENYIFDDGSYGIAFDDWNFDGYLDISMFAYPGGSMGNSPHYYWLWNSKQGKFVENTDLEDISEGCRVSITENNQIEALTKHGAMGYTIFYYEYENNNFILKKLEEHKADK